MCIKADKLISTIINKYFLFSYCLTFVTDDNNGNLVENITINVPYLFYKYEDKTNDTVLSNFLLNSFELGCLNYIICSNDPKQFLHIFDENILETYQRNGNKKLVFLPPNCDEESKHVLEDFLQEELVRFYPFILLVIPVINATNKYCDVFELGTQKYVGAANHNELIILDKWYVQNESLRSRANLFPDKLKNLYGRHVKVSAFTYKPYSVIALDEYGNVTDLHGTELKVVVEFCRRHNCSVEMILDDHEWGDLYYNRTGNGLLGNLALDKSDLALAGCFLWYKEYTLLQFSSCVIRSGITCLVPAPLLIPTYLLPILPFSVEMWYSVLGSIFYISVVLYYARKFTGKSYSMVQSVIQVISIMVGQTVHERKLTATLRYLLNIIFYFALIIYNAYNSGLSSSMTVKTYGKKINTVEDLVKSNLDWAATHDSWIFSLRNVKNPMMVHLYNKFRHLPAYEMEERQTTRDLAIAVERMPAGFFALGDYITEEALGSMKLLSEDIYYEHSVILGRPSSPFITKINKLIGKLQQAGILEAWETQVTLKYSSYYIQAGVKNSQFSDNGQEPPHAIGMFHILGPMIVLAFGYTTAIVVFIGEILYGGKKNKHIRDTESAQSKKTKTKIKTKELVVSKDMLSMVFIQNYRLLNKRRYACFKLDCPSKLKVKRLNTDKHKGSYV